MNPDSVAIMLFVKAPVPGQVKTRLATQLGDAVAADLYRCFVNDLIKKLDAAGLPLRILHDPPDAGAALRRWLGRDRIYAPQLGNGLGERMKQAFQDVFASGVRRAVLMGSDLPDLPARIAEDALAALQTKPSVIGPAKDGGYYLIGFRAEDFHAPVFDDMPWSSEKVLKESLARLKKAGLNVHRLPVWRDIDTPEALTDLMAALTASPETAPETARYCGKILNNLTGPMMKGQR